MIELKNISLVYSDVEVLKDFNLSFAEGSMTAIMGANGCGKTTLMRIIAGLLPPTKGKVVVEGQPLASFPPRSVAQKIALVQQKMVSSAFFTAYEVVMMGRNPYLRPLQGESQDDYDIVQQSMQQTNTWHLRNRYVDQISGGEYQRVMIARALCQQTPLLLLDEPVSNLDIAHQIEIMQLLTKLSNRTILIAIHDLNLALHYCDNLLLIADHSPLFFGKMTDGLTTDNIRKAYNVEAKVVDGMVQFGY